MDRKGRPAKHSVGSKRPSRRRKDGSLKQSLWFSLQVAEEHAKTQKGVDIRDQLLHSYDRPSDA